MLNTVLSVAICVVVIGGLTVGITMEVRLARKRRQILKDTIEDAIGFIENGDPDTAKLCLGFALGWMAGS